MNYKHFLTWILAVVFTLSMQTLVAQPVSSMYGDKFKADIKVKYVYTLEEALRKAKTERKPIFFNCFADWAIPCHGMNMYVFSDVDFANYMNKTFVNLFIDVSKRENKHIAERYSIRSFAHYLILDANGEVISRIVGGKKLPEFKADIVRLLHPKTSLVGTQKAYDLGKRSKKDLFNYLYALSLADEQEKIKQVATQYFGKLTPKEYSKKENWTYFKQLISDSESDLFRFLIDNKEKFIQSNGTAAVNYFIETHYSTDVAEMALGTSPYQPSKLIDIRLAMQKADLPDTCLTYALYDVAKLRGERKYEELLDYLRRNSHRFGQQKSSVDLSLDLPEISESQRVAVIAYLRETAASETSSENLSKQLNSLADRLEHNQGVVFDPISFDEALAKAKSENKLLFLDAYTSWCTPCRKMADDIFPLPEVGQAFTTRFVSIKIDMEKGEGKKIAAKYAISAYPTMLVIDSEGKELKRIVGYRNGDELIREVLDFDRSAR